MSRALTNKYFAYGSNMVRTQMEQRCPGAVVAGLATLTGHRFLINARSYATIVPDRDHVVHGILWHLSPSHEDALDHYESVSLGHYFKGQVELDLMDGTRIRAMTYFAANQQPGRPGASYIDSILASAREFNFPMAYQEWLKRWA